MPSSRRQRHPSGFWRYLAIVCVSTIPMVADPAPAQPSPKILVAGELENLELNAVKTSIPLRFCPLGELHPGDPDLGLAATVKLGPFFLSESEITQRQYFAVCGKEAFEKVRRRAVDSKLGDVFVDPGSASSSDPKYDFPVLGLTLDEAVLFCQRLEEVNGQAGAPVIVKRRFRLPSHLEWQYACRGWPDPKNPGAKMPLHFNRWDKDFWKKDADLAKLCRGKWQRLVDAQVAEGVFEGDEKQVVQIAKYFKNDIDSDRILAAFLKAGADCLAPVTPDQDSEPRSVKASKVANGWNLRDMHGNAGEFTLLADQPDKLNHTETQSRVVELWEVLRKNNKELKDQERLDKEMKIVLAGGSFNSYTREGRWQLYTIWGGDMASDRLKDAIIGYTAACTGDESMTLRAGGIRLLVDYSLSEEWAWAVRHVAGVTGERTPRAVEELESQRETIQELMPGAKSESAQSMIDFYVACARYLRGETAEAGRLIRTMGQRPMGSDPFVSILGSLVEDDAKLIK